MRSNTGNRRSCLAALAAGAIGLAVAGTAAAGGRYEERIHADSFGNLVIYSPGGYKRIVVGKGYLAEELAAEQGLGDPEVVYLEEDAYRGRYRLRCNREPVLLHGRSYMYGLPDGVLPAPAGTCR